MRRESGSLPIQEQHPFYPYQKHHNNQYLGGLSFRSLTFLNITQYPRPFLPLVATINAMWPPDNHQLSGRFLEDIYGA